MITVNTCTFVSDSRGPKFEQSAGRMHVVQWNCQEKQNAQIKQELSGTFCWNCNFAMTMSLVYWWWLMTVHLLITCIINYQPFTGDPASTSSHVFPQWHTGVLRRRSPTPCLWCFPLFAHMLSNNKHMYRLYRNIKEYYWTYIIRTTKWQGTFMHILYLTVSFLSHSLDV